MNITHRSDELPTTFLISPTYAFHRTTKIRALWQERMVPYDMDILLHKDMPRMTAATKLAA